MPIESRVEAADEKDASYASRRVGKKGIAALRHRRMVGGLWEEMGQLQLDFLRQRGLEPQHRFIDVGCGSLRAGRLIAEYLEPTHYYGIDVNHELVQAGYDNELSDEVRARLPEDNLRMSDRFDVDFGVRFDMGIAQSVFSHLSLNNLRLCLTRVAASLDVGGRFYVTYFEQPEDYPVDGIADRHGRSLFTERNFFWYYRSDMVWAAERLPLQATYVGDWGHPRGQVMMEYVRTEG